uniref:C-type lectin domain-containing protein n=1 Tax=Fundulus heteroclitus TaxID=8078 RepID=A0A3Q2QIY3_FUNHE
MALAPVSFRGVRHYSTLELPLVEWAYLLPLILVPVPSRAWGLWVGFSHLIMPIYRLHVTYWLLTKIILPTLPLNSVVGQCPGFCLGSCSKFPPRKYYYVEMSRTWFEAQQFCREHYTDLATFENIEDVNRLKAPFSYSWAWIGLWDDPNSWKNEMGNESNSWRVLSTSITMKISTVSMRPHRMCGLMAIVTVNSFLSATKVMTKLKFRSM